MKKLRDDIINHLLPLLIEEYENEGAPHLSGLIKNFKTRAENGEARLILNPTGRFVIGGPHGDTGLTGRKTIVDTYGGWAPHGGGAFSGKDPSKVDRSAAYMARYVAKNMVEAGVAKEVTLQVAYAIGVPEPVSIHVECRELHADIKDPREVEEFVKQSFDFRPGKIIKFLKLDKPIYLPTAAYGHFGRSYYTDSGLEFFTWERTDAADNIRRVFNL